MTNMGGCKKKIIKKEVEERESERERERERVGEHGEDFLLVCSNLAAARAPILKSH